MIKAKLENRLIPAMLLASVATFTSTTVLAIGGPSGAHIDYVITGKIGQIIMNPYGIAPLTATIKNGGYVLRDVTVRIVPKEGGQEIKYSVANKHILTHGGIPVFGLYPDYANTVEVEYTRVHGSSAEKIQETYNIYAPPVYAEPAGGAYKAPMFTAKVNKMSPEFKDRLYFVNNLYNKSGKGSRVVWNNPVGGALEWTQYPQNAIIDSTGEIRWYMLPAPIFDMNSIYNAGIMMGFRQNDDGQMSWGYGQRYAKYDIMGRESFNRRLPEGYIDFSHSMHNSPNGNYFIRVASADLKRLDGKNVRTVRDMIIEVDPSNGNVIDEWRMFDILDPYRDVVLKTLDQGAVCLNLDASQAGHTLTDEEIAKMDASDSFGDIVGSGPGRNWLHVNSVEHDIEDDSIIISSRHQSAIIKVGRNKQVKWILGSPEGWKAEYIDKILKPIDAQGKAVKCENSKCEGDFDWTWTQHTAFKIPSMSKGDTLFITAFDNGDGRGMEQPALPSDKYSRAVVYKIDQKAMTVQQVWEYGKERGNAWYSPVTSLTEYHADKNSIFAYSATAGAEFNFDTGAFVSTPNPFINEFKWGEKEPAVEIQLIDTIGYQAMPFSLAKAFEK